MCLQNCGTPAIEGRGVVSEVFSGAAAPISVAIVHPHPGLAKRQSPYRRRRSSLFFFSRAASAR